MTEKMELKQGSYTRLLEFPAGKRVYVASITPDGKISLAQKIRIKEYGKEVELFLQNAFLFFDEKQFNDFVNALSEIEMPKMEK